MILIPDISLWNFIKQIFMPLVIPPMVIVMLVYLISPYMPVAKSPVNLLATIGAIAGIIGVTLLVQLFFSMDLREKVKTTVGLINFGRQAER